MWELFDSLAQSKIREMIRVAIEVAEGLTVSILFRGRVPSGMQITKESLGEMLANAPEDAGSRERPLSVNMPIASAAGCPLALGSS